MKPTGYDWMTAKQLKDALLESVEINRRIVLIRREAKRRGLDKQCEVRK